MRWFLDTEFNDRGTHIELISIALVSESGREYYAHSSEYDVSACDEWLQTNVLPLLSDKPRIPRAQIAAGIQRLVAQEKGVPEFWAYYAAYDWVLFCQLFGGALKLPGYSKHCKDLKQLIDDRGIHFADLPKQRGVQHDALQDALWVRDGYFWIQNEILRRTRTTPA